MVNNIILLLISMSIIFGYYFYYRIKYGRQKSISDSVYIVKPWWLFAITMMAFPIPFVIAAENIALVHETGSIFGDFIREFTAFWAGGLICLVGVANCFYKPDKQEETLHVVGATGGIALGLTFISSISLWYLIPVSLYALFIAYCRYTKKYRNYSMKKVTSKYLILFYLKPYLEKLKVFIGKLPTVPYYTETVELVAIILLFGTVLFESLKLP